MPRKCMYAVNDRKSPSNKAKSWLNGKSILYTLWNFRQDRITEIVRSQETILKSFNKIKSSRSNLQEVRLNDQ